MSNEINEQGAVQHAVATMGLNAMKDWFNWLSSNGFDIYNPNPTNDFVRTFYGKEPLWKTNLSQGIVVRNSEDDDFYIVMECSDENTGFHRTQIVLTLGGCL